MYPPHPPSSFTSPPFPPPFTPPPKPLSTTDHPTPSHHPSHRWGAHLARQPLGSGAGAQVLRRLGGGQRGAAHRSDAEAQQGSLVLYGEAPARSRGGRLRRGWERSERSSEDVMFFLFFWLLLLLLLLLLLFEVLAVQVPLTFESYAYTLTILDIKSWIIQK